MKRRSEYHFNVNLTTILACDPTGIIGINNDLPWKHGELQGDLQRFKTLTEGKIVIMGKATYRSLPTYPKGLPGRLNVVVTTGKDIDLDDLFKIGKGLQAINPFINIDNFNSGDNVLFVRNSWRTLRNDNYITTSYLNEYPFISIIESIYAWQLSHGYVSYFTIKEKDNNVYVDNLDIVLIGGATMYDELLNINSNVIKYWTGATNNITSTFGGSITVVNLSALNKVYLTISNKLYKGNVYSKLATELIKGVTNKERVCNNNQWKLNYKSESLETHTNFIIDINQQTSK